MAYIAKPANTKSAINYFKSLMHEEFKYVFPGKTVDFIDFQGKCAKKWKTLTLQEREPFDKMASLDKQRFQQEVKNFPPLQIAKKKVKKVKDPNEPKKPLTAFFLFSNEKRASIKQENPDFSIGDVAKKLGQLWRDLGQDEKRVFEEAAVLEKSRYAKAMEAFKEGKVVDHQVPPILKTVEDVKVDSFEKLDAMMRESEEVEGNESVDKLTRGKNESREIAEVDPFNNELDAVVEETKKSNEDEMTVETEVPEQIVDNVTADAAIEIESPNLEARDATDSSNGMAFDKLDECLEGESDFDSFDQLDALL